MLPESEASVVETLGLGGAHDHDYLPGAPDEMRARLSTANINSQQSPEVPKAENAKPCAKRSKVGTAVESRWP